MRFGASTDESSESVRVSFRRVWDVWRVLHMCKLLTSAVAEFFGGIFYRGEKSRTHLSCRCVTESSLRVVGRLSKLGH